MNGYHVTKEQAEKFALSNPNYVAQYYPNRHNDNQPDWGVWNKKDCHWVYVEVDKHI